MDKPMREKGQAVQYDDVTSILGGTRSTKAVRQVFVRTSSVAIDRAGGRRGTMQHGFEKADVSSARETSALARSAAHGGRNRESSLGYFGLGLCSGLWGV